jgi:hypothetical protein
MPSFSVPKAATFYRCSFFLFFIIVVFCDILNGQKFLTDTIRVNFHADSLIDNRQFNILEIQDLRDDNPCFVRFESKKKYLFIPVDQEIYTKRPLAEEILSGFSEDTRRSVNYSLDIRKFEIIRKKERFSSSVYLVADIPVYEMVLDTNRYIGTLYYDYLYQPLRDKESSQESTENLLSKWHTDFKIDLLTIRSDSSGIANDITSNFIDNPKVRSLYLNIQGGSFVGANWWGMQGEIYFSRPETSLRGHFSSGIIRYQNNSDYESFAIGKNSEHYTLRKNKVLSVDIDLNILMGFCKWKNIELNDPTLYQLFDVEVSSIQSLMYNPLNSRGLTARIGLIENISFIIDKRIRFQPGIFFGLGFKI